MDGNSTPRAKPLRIGVYIKESHSQCSPAPHEHASITQYEAFGCIPESTAIITVFKEIGPDTAPGRPEFQRLLENCRDGKVNLVITRSVSGVGRNLTEVLRITHDLSAQGVGIYYESEGLLTLESMRDAVNALYASQPAGS